MPLYRITFGMRFLGGKKIFMELTIVAVGWFIDFVGS
jgi:hypothetical protein